jgi:hypothetical protein
MSSPSCGASIGLMIHEHRGRSETAAREPSEGADRELLLDRLQHMRAMLSAFAHEAASARRHAARLRLENRRLLEEVHRLHEHIGR